MPNPENVIPYGNLIHDVAMHGGVDQYLSDHAEVNYQRGLQDGHEDDWLIAIGSAILGGLLMKGADVVAKKVSENRQKKRAQLIEDSKKVEEAIKKEFAAEPEAEEE